MTVRISHMESCLACGTTTSSALERNDEIEAMAKTLVDLAERAHDHKAMQQVALGQINRMAGFSSDGSCSYAGPTALYNLRRARIAIQALEAMVLALEPHASSEHRFDKTGHKI